MCQYQTLFHDDQTGYVIRCGECERIQVAFGNLLVTFEYADYISFYKWIRKIYNETHPSQNLNTRSVLLPTPCEGMKWILSIREMQELENMLEEADSEMRSLEMIQLFEREF